jgi:hypothetical protein
MGFLWVLCLAARFFRRRVVSVLVGKDTAQEKNFPTKPESYETA